MGLGSIIFLAGAGRTGKTSTVQEYLKLEPETVFVPSIVRSFMQSKGIESEADFYTRSEDDRKSLSIELTEKYIENIKDKTKDKTKNYIFDRSFYDHIGYAVYNNLHSYILDNLTLSYNEALLTIKSRYFYFHLPYPCPWSNTQDSDEFRHKIDLKESVVDRVTRSKTVNHATLPVNLSASERALLILQTISPSRISQSRTSRFTKGHSMALMPHDF